ncbi:DUF1552 domain-containing protein [Frigoriglobus tundricola]|uniref:DUF1552 domain-containing protein n=1 Tax=Frigoriglobus tundricola TaxID=2774151 RepID=A0A6M5Z1W5_9BACT|nr:DUF1552 domain-containing protein [Frigoriglobus tundricola]QJX00179.1 hypothetical protein FTUN_7803 [Frigoriglobus tundricola]
MTANTAVSRRVLLKGLGVTVALPWLESVPALASPAAKKPAQRFACLFIGDGISPPHWWARGAGADMELGSSLEPLARFKEKLNVIDGLWNKEGDGGHAKCTGNILSGAALSRGRTIKGGVSMDQLLAKHYEEETAQPSLVLGCEQPVSGFHESQYSMVYASHISWRNSESPVPIELYPALAFDSLFGGKAGKLQGSILDDVLSQANDLSGKVSGTDKQKLDEYLSSVRETEQRVQRLNKMAQDDTAVPAAARPSPAQPKDFREYARLMCDIIALAFQTDRSRVATLLLSRDLSGQVYPFLGVRDDHHSYSHSNEGKEYQAIVKFHVDQYAYLIDKLSKMKEADGSVLDNSCIMFVSEHWNAHNGSRVPVILAGGLGGTLKTGRTLDYLKAGNDKRKLCSLYLTLMDRMGLKLPEFGDAKERLAGI